MSETAESTSSREERNRATAQIYGRKVGLVTAAIFALLCGLLTTTYLLLRTEHDETSGHHSAFVQWIVSHLPQPVLENAEGTRIVGSIVVVLLVFALLCVLSLTLIRAAAARYAREHGGFSNFGLFCVAVTRNGLLAGWSIFLSGLFLWITLTWVILRYIGFVPYLRWTPFVVGVSLAVVCVGIATIMNLPLILRDLFPLPVQVIDLPAPSPARATGQELMEQLRQSPVFRRQIYCDVMLDERKFGYSREGRQMLLDRFARLEAILPKIGINALSSDQTTALSAAVANEKKHIGRDLVFIGRPGSGRTTMANLLALGVTLQNEGAVHWVTPDSPSRDGDGADAPAMLRHPAVQLRSWLERAKLQGTIRMQTSFRDDDQPLDLAEAPQILYTDARMLSQSVLTRVRGAARGLLSRLKYVIVDQPERLSREDLVRLRLAMCRLRMTGELLGTPITFIIILPRLNNAIEIAKYLVNRSEVEAIAFGTWLGRCNMVGWVPPLEIFNRDDNTPSFVRASFVEESISLLTELGFQANRLEKPLRIAVVDAKPLFGPEARDLVRERVREAIAAEAADDSFEVRARWRYVSHTDLGGEHDQEFDVVVSLGIGGFPRELVSSLRPAVAAEGALILIADSSSDDIESLTTIATHRWSPEREDERHRFPTLLLPDHSDAVLAHEMAALFEDFSSRPLPVHRLLEVFPGERVDQLLDTWKSEKRIREVFTYENLRDNERWPKMLRCVIRSDDAFTSELYEIPWGCCSRNIYKIYDISANRESVAGPFLSNAVDFDRIFIDFYPQMVLRYPPNTLLVRQKRDLGPARAATLVDLPGRYRELGRLEVETMHRDDCIRIDRRTARINTRVLGERTSDGVSDVRGRITRRDLSSHSRLRLAAGEWYCRIAEKVRDVVRTSDRLVEDPDYSTVVKIAADDAPPLQREMESPTLSLFIEPQDGWSARAGGPDPLGDYASHHALARSMERYLRRDFLHFDTEFRVAVVTESNGARLRIVIYRVRSDELGWNHTLSSILEPEDLYAMFDSIHQRLERCDCEDGCSICCGALGTIPRSLLPRHGYENEDAISRSGAYQLVCGILGRTADWEEFGRGKVDRLAPPITGTESQLSQLVAEVIGTEVTGYTDGLWHKLFGGSMRLTAGSLAQAEWMDAATMLAHAAFAGFYSPADNRVVVRPHADVVYLKEVLVHEFTHNWQFRGDLFDLQTHYLGPEMKPYFDGTLVIEGHAVWCEQLFRAYQRLGASYTMTDSRPWNEYKVGYLLMEGIEKAIGQTGLFRWLCQGEKPRDVRSQNPRIRWPFTLVDALRNLNLLRFVRREPFSGFDVRTETKSTTTAPPNAPPEPPPLPPPPR